MAGNSVAFARQGRVGAADVGEPRPVLLDPLGGEQARYRLAGLLQTATALGTEDVSAVLRWVAGIAPGAPRPGADTIAAWELLASLASVDVAAARIAEPHLDALAILAQAPVQPELERVGVTSASMWGVYASEAEGASLTASRCGEEWVLHGVKPWCSLARHVTHALVTALDADGKRRLFAVDMRSAGVFAEDGPWVARGLSRVVSAPVRFAGVRAVPVGPAGWYTHRPGFFWGGIGVAACWWGGAVGVARALYAAQASGDPDQVALMHLGAVDASLTAARAALREAAARIDAREIAAAELPVLMLRVRDIAAEAVEATIERAGHALGPAPLSRDEGFAARVADLQLYVRQHHAERDLAALGGRLLERGGPAPW